MGFLGRIAKNVKDRKLAMDSHIRSFAFWCFVVKESNFVAKLRHNLKYHAFLPQRDRVISQTF